LTTYISDAELFDSVVMKTHSAMNAFIATAGQ